MSRLRSCSRTEALSLALSVALVLALLPIANAGAVVAPGDPIENLTPTGDKDTLLGDAIDISDDGNWVVFASDATNLTTDPDNAMLDIFLIDRSTGVTTNITPVGNHHSSQPEISADGSTVVFLSHASNLTSDADLGSDGDVFRYDVASGVTTRITPDSPNGHANGPSVSGDGSRIVLRSTAELAGSPGGPFPVKIYLWQAGTFTHLTDGQPLAKSFNSAISDDGGTAYFSSTINGGPRELHAWDVATGTATYVALGSSVKTNDDGSVVAFYAGGAIHLMDRTNPAAPITTSFPGDTSGFALTGDGNHLLTLPFIPSNPSYLDHYDATTGVTTRLLPQGPIHGVAGNVDGSVVAFTSPDGSVTADPDNAKRDVYVMVESSVVCDGVVVTVDLNLGQSPTQGDDVIMGTPGDDVIYGLGGNDIVCGDTGDDFIVGGAGDDVLFGGQGVDVVYGSIGDDVIHGGAAADDLRGGAGNDEIWAQAGGGVVFGGSGADMIRGGPDADDIQAGTGDDSVWGYGGADTIRGLGGNDTLYGGAGDDLVVGGGGLDTIHGGAGADVIHGHTGDDVLYGDAGNDVLQGGEQNDELHGGADDDLLAGAGGTDMLFGEAGDDDLLGGAGSDDLSGGSGVDDCHGQADTDTEDGTCETVISVP